MNIQGQLSQAVIPVCPCCTKRFQASHFGFPKPYVPNMTDALCVLHR